MTPLQAILDAHTTDRVDDIGRNATCSGAVALASRDGEVTHSAVAGSRRLLPGVAELERETPFDLASVTKLFTATLVAVAVERGLVSWDAPMRELTDGWGNAATLQDVVEHVSGLPAWEKFYEDLPLNPSEAQAASAREAVREKILARELAPLHGSHTYSDLGYILLGLLLEEWFGAALPEVLRETVTEPLGLESIVYGVERPSLMASAASTEWCSRRGRWVTGTVHDENCDVLGGVAGHAGLFGTADDLLRFGQEMLEIAAGRDGTVSAETLRHIWAGRPEARSHRGGWDTPDGATSSVGRGFPRGTTFGHLGFTGTSLWVETTTATAVVLLTNRVHPSRENARIKGLRVAVHESIWPPD